MDNSATYLLIGFDRSYNADDVRRYIDALSQHRGVSVQPYTVPGTLPMPVATAITFRNLTPDVPAAPVAPAVATVPAPPFPGANVKPATNGNGFKAWDAELRQAWLCNNTPGNDVNGRPIPTMTWKINVGGKGSFGRWYSISDRPALLASAKVTR